MANAAAVKIKTADHQPELLRADHQGVTTITLNRPDARNALSWSMMQALLAMLAGIKSDPSVKAVIIAGAGPGFCSGHDLKELQANKNHGQHKATFELCSTLMQAIVTLPQPVIARVHGVATAAGCQLVASCDLAVAATVARFATPGVNLGLFCSTPMVALSRNVGRKAAMEMLLLGETIDAEKARDFGLISHVVPLERLEAATLEIATKIVKKSPRVIANGKEAFYRQLEMNLSDAYAYTSEVMARNVVKPDAVEGIGAFLEKRDPNWRDE
jgi:enoyl-CoA hydratase/carnithine racemase